MRILKITQTYYPYLSKGGPPAKVRAIAKALAGRGHEVTVLTADRGETDGETKLADLTDWSRSPSAWGWEAQDHGVETVYLPTMRNYRATTVNPRILRFCTRRLREYDVVHIYGLYDLIGSTAGWFCRRYGIPYVLEPLGMFGSKVRSRQKKRLYRKLVGDSLFKGANAIIATSETERDELIEGGIAAAKIVLRRNGIDLSEFESLPARGAFRAKLGIREQTPLILFLGRLSFIKGLDLLVKAFARLDAETHLVIAGPDDFDGCAQTVRKLIEEFGVGNRVTLTGPLYGKAKLEALVDADLFVLPSRYESFGNAAAESIACGTPVLVTDQCGIAPLVEGKAGLVVPYDVEALHRGMKRLLEDEVLSVQLRAGCAEVAGGLSWEEPVAAMETLYASLQSAVGSRQSAVSSFGAGDRRPDLRH
ncbi:MAG: glycosyltransferase [Pyrinomonadaceae bacterium]|nr:glycosyltransferase [Pyrinomonadaceae bacterium]